MAASIPPRKPGERAADERARESRRILERVARDSETIGRSSFARVANRLRDHFSGDAEKDDAAEIWGKRIGRTLGAIAFAFLAWHVLTTYILK